MADSDLIGESTRTTLLRVVRDLHYRFEGVFGQQTIEKLVFDSYCQMAAKATITDWLVPGTERLARDRLEALVRSEDHSPKKVPAVLFVCTHNAGRSQMALGWLTHLGQGRAIGWSGGSQPESELNKVAVAAMAEAGIDISDGFPKPWTIEVLEAADVVITMGCGDACPLAPGKHYEDWDVADPAGQPLDVIRPIRDDIEGRVRDLLDRFGADPR